MRRFFFLLLISLTATACTYDLKTNKQVVDAIAQKGHAKSVTVTDRSVDTVGFTGTKKDILVDMGANASSEKTYQLSIAYHCADTAYKISLANKAKMPDVFSVVVKSGGQTSKAFDYNSEYLAKSKTIWKSIQPFMDSLIAKKYNALNNMVAKNLDISPAINALKQADSAGLGVSGYKALALRHVVDELPFTGQKINIVQTWVVINVNGKYYPMMLAVGAGNLGIYGVFINPQNQL